MSHNSKRYGWRRPSVLPGFGLTFGISLAWLTMIVLIPLSTLFLKSAGMGWSNFLQVGFSDRALAAYRLSFGASLYDPSYITTVVRSDSLANALKYNNPDMDALIAEAGAELDEARRCELYTQIDQLIGQDAVFLAPFRGTSTWFFKPNVRGMKIVNQRVWHSIHQVYIAAE